MHGRDRKRARGLSAARRLFSRAKPILRAYPNVRSVGVGLREKKGRVRNEACFVVTVDRKEPQAAIVDTIPRRLFGVPVDVKPATAGRLTGVAGGNDVRQAGRLENGHIGLCARGPDGTRYAVTVMHVLVSDTPCAYPPLPPFDVEAQMVGLDYAKVGALEFGRLAGDGDIARIRVDDGVSVESWLQGTSIELDRPLDIHGADVGIAVRMTVADEAPEVDGIVDEYPCDGDFGTDTGQTRHFTGLIKFRFSTPAIPPGWSGSIIYRPRDQAPIALLSIGAVSSSGGETFAWGFPLFPIYTSWSLKPA